MQKGIVSKEMWNEKSVQLLVLANMVPVFGVLFLNWSLFAIVFLYWFENVIIGVFNILKMRRAEGSLEGETAEMNGTLYTRTRRAGLIFFFIIHYGLFTLVHGMFVVVLFGPNDQHITTLLLGIVSLVSSHGISYVSNFIHKEEYKRVAETQLFIQPYKRIVVLHITIIFGGMLVKILGAPVFGILLLVFLKTSMDLLSHRLEHVKVHALLRKG